MAQHKWHKEICAWANGAEIEVFYESQQDWCPAPTNPTWGGEYKYRIKPQPKEPQYLYAYEAGGEYRLSWCRAEQMPFQLGDRMIPMNYKGKIKLEEELT
jgi:hypothetical protein